MIKYMIESDEEEAEDVLYFDKYDESQLELVHRSCDGPFSVNDYFQQKMIQFPEQRDFYMEKCRAFRHQFAHIKHIEEIREVYHSKDKNKEVTKVRLEAVVA